MREGWGGSNISTYTSNRVYTGTRPLSLERTAHLKRVIASPAFRKALQAAHKKLNEASHEALHPRSR